MTNVIEQAVGLDVTQVVSGVYARLDDGSFGMRCERIRFARPVYAEVGRYPEKWGMPPIYVYYTQALLTKKSLPGVNPWVVACGQSTDDNASWFGSCNLVVCRLPIERGTDYQTKAVSVMRACWTAPSLLLGLNGGLLRTQVPPPAEFNQDEVSKLIADHVTREADWYNDDATSPSGVASLKETQLYAPGLIDLLAECLCRVLTQ